MPTTTHGLFHWNELMTRDVGKAKAFYADTLGWSYEAFPMEEGEYTVCKAGDEMAGGIMEMTPDEVSEGTSDRWLSYITVDDVDARVAKVAAAGGEVLSPPFDVPQVGRIAMVKDKVGAVIGWITPAPQEGE